ncbi:MAG: GNAT family N-acetyltransferase [Candidatus Sericytochromatia bacterium]|nr:GNAT family N-acetyltransferase [Candidatus Sericytochromatia bacterium]
MKLVWHDTLTGLEAAAWDEAWKRMDLHPFQHRQLAIDRAHCHGQELRFVTGWQDRELVFGAAVQVRKSWPWPPRLAVTRGPWAVDETSLVAGLHQLLALFPPGLQPMSLRVDPHLPLPALTAASGLADLGFAPAPAELHQQTIRCDVSGSEADMLAGFRTLTRRMIKKAGNAGLSTEFGTADDLASYLVMHGTAASQKGYGQPQTDWCKALLGSGLAWLALTRQGDRVVGGGVFARGARTVHYLYGATDPQFEGPALYDVFWSVMRHAKALGCSVFDLGGLPDAEDGIAFFKRGWGGREVRFLTERERVVQPLALGTWTWVRRQLRGREQAMGQEESQ